MIRPFAALVRKDLTLFFSDRRAVLMSVLAPIAIASFFGFIFSDADRKDAARVPVLVVDDDHSAIAREVVARLTSDPALEVTVTTIRAAQEAVRHAKVACAIHLPSRFGAGAAAAFFSGGTQKKAEIDLLYDPSRATEASMVQGILTGHVMQAVSREMFSGETGRTSLQTSLAEVEQSVALPPTEKSALLEMLRGVKGWNDTAKTATPGRADVGVAVPFDVKKHAVTSATGIPYNGYAHAFAGMGVQFILFMAIEMGVGLLLQRQYGMWKRLRAAPLSRTVLLGARAASTALLSLFILFFLFLFARVVFGVRISGSLVGFVAVCVSFSLMTASFGLLIASLGKTPDGTRGLSIVATLLLVMLGGAWVPTFIFPRWLQSLTIIVPTRWAIDGLDATTWRGLGFMAVAWPVTFLLATAGICGVLAVARFRWEVQ
jgi:ABC-2 type transport system permease protein